MLLFPCWLLAYTEFGSLFTGLYLRFFIYLWVSLILGALLTHGSDRLLRVSGLIAGLLIAASALIMSVALINVTDYPFSLFWSEGNRMWDFSVLFGRRLYDYPADKPIFTYIDLGRQLVWGLPFFFLDISISQMRLWTALVITVPYAVFGWIAFKRFPRASYIWFLCGLWVFTFLSQGPIYTPLVLSAILVSLAWRFPRWWLALPLIFLAAYFAQTSRFTWMFAPAMWAAMLFFSSPGPGDSRKPDWKLALAGAAVLDLGAAGHRTKRAESIQERRGRHEGKGGILVHEQDHIF